MAETASKGLPYGHFGQAAYYSESKEWRFTRHVEQNRSLRGLGVSEVVCEPTASNQDPREDPRARLAPSQRRIEQFKQLIRTHPEAESASGIIPPLLLTSETIVEASAQWPLDHGSLLAIGLIPSEVTHRRVEVAAHPGGPNGSDLCLTALSNQRRYWTGSKAAWLNVPTVTGEQSIWKGPGVPIQQICFAQPHGHGDYFLAVRLRTETLVFRPVFRKHPPAGSVSALDPNLICRIPMDNKTESSPVDVAFCPRRTSRLAIVDDAGHCVVRDAANDEWLCAFDIFQDSPRDIDDIGSDGWASLTWVLGASFLVVASRRELGIFDISSAPNRVLDLELDLKKDSSLVLDVQLLPGYDDAVCVLTSSRLTIFRFRSDEQKAVKAVCLVGWHHYMTAELLDLSLCALRDDADIVLLLRSTTRVIQTAYRITLDALGVVHASEPTSVDIPGETSAVTDLIARPLEYGGRIDLIAGEYGCTPRVHGVLSLSGSLEVRQSFLCSQHSPLRKQVPLPLHKAAVKGRGSRLAREGFVVDEDTQFVAELIDRRKPISQHVKRRLAALEVSSNRQWTLSYQPTTEYVCQQSSNHALDFLDGIAQAQQYMERQDNDGDALPTLHQLAPNYVNLNDIDTATEGLSELLNSVPPLPSSIETNEDSSSRKSIRPAAIPAGAGFIAGNESLSSTYDRIVRQHVSPLSSNVAGRTRLAKDEVARRLAVDVVLSSHVVGATSPYTRNETQQTQSKSESWELPVRPTASQGFPSSQTFDIPSSQTALPTPSPTATPSVTTGSSYPSSVAAPEVSRLSRYTTFEKPAPPPLPRALNRILTHWTPGADPANYDWISTYRRLEQQNEEVDDDMTEKERARMQRKAARHMRRQRREAEASQQQQVASSQAPQIAQSQSQGFSRHPPPLTMGSQPPAAVLASSQSQGMVQAPPAASQVERGKFGGKPPKKKRKSGF